MIQSFLKAFARPVYIIPLIIGLVPLALALRFTHVHGASTPYADQWCDAVPMVINAAEGDMQLQELYRWHNTHRIFPASLTTLTFYYLTDWNLKAEIYVNYVWFAVVIGILLWTTLRAERPTRDYTVAFIAFMVMAALFFSLRLRVFWLWPYAAPYVQAYAFLLIGWFLIARSRVNWVTLVSVALLCALATTAISSSLMMWVIFGIGLFIYGYRRFVHAALWLGFAAVTIVLFFNNYGNVGHTNFCDAGAAVGGLASNLQTIGLLPMLHFLTRFLAGPFFFYYEDEVFYGTTEVGLFIILFGLVNIAYMLWLWRQQRDLTSPLIFGSVLAFAGGSMMLIALGRGGVLSFRAHIFMTNYILQPTVVLVVFGILAVLATVHITRKATARPLERTLQIFNIAALIGFAGLYISANVGAADLERYPHDIPGYYTPAPRHAECIRNFFFAEVPCGHDAKRVIWMGDREFEHYVWRLAEYRLAEFSHIAFTMPSEYTRGQQVVIYAPFAAQQLRVVDARGRAVPEADIYRVLRADQADILMRHNVAADKMITYNGDVSIVDLSSLPGEFWYLGVTDIVPEDYLAQTTPPPTENREAYDLPATFYREVQLQ